jgi:hypothetical protein
VLAHYKALYRFAFALTRSEPEALFDTAISIRFQHHLRAQFTMQYKDDL